MGQHAQTARTIEQAKAAMSNPLATNEELRDAFRLILGQLVVKDSEIARLRAEIDAYEGHTVAFATAAQARRITAGEPGPNLMEGLILRATDTGEQWVRTAGMWEEKP